jgi:hypothetical protein
MKGNHTVKDNYKVGDTVTDPYGNTLVIQRMWDYPTFVDYEVASTRGGYSTGGFRIYKQDGESKIKYILIGAVTAMVGMLFIILYGYGLIY